jgi:hypothetical protein
MVYEASLGHALALYNDTLFAGAPNNPGFWGEALVYNLAQSHARICCPGNCRSAHHHSARGAVCLTHLY